MVHRSYHRPCHASNCDLAEQRPPGKMPNVPSASSGTMGTTKSGHELLLFAHPSLGQHPENTHSSVAALRPVPCP